MLDLAGDPPEAASTAEPAPGADGTQAIRRAAAILKAIAGATPRGLTLAEISRSQVLSRSTAHRILKCLLDEGFVEHMAGSRRYQMGALAYELGLAVPGSALEVGRWRAAVEAVALRTGVTTYLMRRNGLEAVCLLKVEGRAVVRVIPVEVGQRRFLGVGAGATALLAALDADTAEHYIALIAPELRHHPRITEASLREDVRRARAGGGVATSHGQVVEQSFGLGVAIPEPGGTPTLAISIAAHLPSVTEADVAAWGLVIQDEIQRALAARSGAPPPP